MFDTSFAAAVFDFVLFIVYFAFCSIVVGYDDLE